MLVVRRPEVKLLDEETVKVVVAKAYEILKRVGVRFNNEEAMQILGDHGASIDLTRKVVRIQEDLIDRALLTVPQAINLYDENGKKTLNLGTEHVFFMPGGTAPFILDLNTGVQRTATSSDMIGFVRLVDSLPNIQINNPAFSISDVPASIEDAFRYFLALLHTTKSLASGGVTSVESMTVIREMMAVVAGGEAELQQKPRNFFSCCPTSPLHWDDNSCHKLFYCARNSIPTLIVPAPGAGATSPVTLLGSILQLTVENLSGIVIHQLVQPGAPVFYGAAATVMDMRSGKNAFGTIESQMINIANAQICRHLRMIAHAIVMTSDAKTVDTQAGLEAAQGILLGALGGVHLISGPGMLDSGLCQSFEKLIIDHDICTMALRLLKSVECTAETLADEVIREIGHGGQFLTAEHTLQWARKEHCFPSTVIRRGSQVDLHNRVPPNAYKTAGELARKTITTHESRTLDEDKKNELIKIITVEGRRHGMDKLPDDSIRR
jgi:trimethylamine--corrinoid protein Co-methyltransferase